MLLTAVSLLVILSLLRTSPSGRACISFSLSLSLYCRCFFSYSYVALLQGGLSTWITANVFPLGGHEMASMEFAKSMWETIFAMLAMFVVAIITGIQTIVARGVRVG